jgi:integrase
MATVYQRPGSPYWYATLDDPRQLEGIVRRSTKSRNKVEARAIARTLQEEIDQAVLTSRPTTGLTWSKAVELYLERGNLAPSTLRTHAGLARLIVQSSLGDFDLSSITVSDVKKYVAELRDTTILRTTRKISDPTIRKYLGLLSRTYQWVIEHEIPGAPESNPFGEMSRRFLGSSRVVDRHIKEVQLSEILDSMKTDEHRRILIVLVGTGLRTGELTTLKWSQVNLSTGYLELGGIDDNRTKTDHSRRVPVGEVVLHTFRTQISVLKASRDYDPDGYVFPSTVPDKNGRRNQPRYGLGYIIKVVRKRTGINSYTNHRLRHTFASWSLQHGVDPIAIRDLLGHKTLSTTTRYANHTSESVADKIRQIPLPGSAQNDTQSGAFGGANLE